MAWKKRVNLPGDVEEDGLEEEGEADPLVVLVVLPPTSVPGRRGHAGVGYLGTNLTINLNIGLVLPST